MRRNVRARSLITASDRQVLRRVSLPSLGTMATTLLALGAIATSSGAEQRVLITNGDLEALREDSDSGCRQIVDLVVRAPQPRYFEGDRVELQLLLGGARMALQLECPQTQEIWIRGVVAGKTIYRGVETAVNDWVLRSLHTNTSESDEGAPDPSQPPAPPPPRPHVTRDRPRQPRVLPASDPFGVIRQLPLDPATLLSQSNDPNQSLKRRYMAMVVAGNLGGDGYVAKLTRGTRAAADGRVDEAVRLWREALSGEVERIIQMLEKEVPGEAGLVPLRQVLPSWDRAMTAQVYGAITLAIEYPNHRGALELAAGIAATRMHDTLRRDQEISAILSSRLGTDPGYQAHHQQRTELASLQFALAAGVELSATQQRRVRQLRTSIAESRRRLARRIDADLRRRFLLDPVQALDAVRRSLRANQRLVQYIEYRPFDFYSQRGTFEDNLGLPRYAALVVGASPEQISITDMGDVVAFDRSVLDFMKSVQSPNPLRSATASREAYRRIFEPLLPHLPEGIELKLSLEGNLNLVPFAALHDGSRWLLDRNSFNYLTASLDLIPRSRTGPSSAPLLIGDPDYAGFSEHLLRRSNITVPFEPLTATRAEVEAIAALLPGARTWLGRDATKQRLAVRPSPSILHLATHGLFLEDASSSPGTRGFTVVASPTRPSTSPRLAHSDVDPLMQAALVFSPQHSEDGLLTAFEVESMDLSGTQLVVLSACDTGLGEVQRHQGVVGFRRSFMVAGAETLVTSLWKVADQSTATLMIDYYRRLADGAGRVEAMESAMRELKKQYPAPYHWAPFIVLGSSLPLDLDLISRIGLPEPRPVPMPAPTPSSGGTGPPADQQSLGSHGAR